MSFACLPSPDADSQPPGDGDQDDDGGGGGDADGNASECAAVSGRNLHVDYVDDGDADGGGGGDGLDLTNHYRHRPLRLPQGLASRRSSHFVCDRAGYDDGDDVDSGHASVLFFFEHQHPRWTLC